MHIVIDAHLSTKKIDGVSRYLNELLLELPRIDPAIQYTILSLPDEASGLPKEIFNFRNVKRFDLNVMGPSPKQHYLMRPILRKLKADLYHHPQFNLPYGIKIPCVVTIHDLKYLFFPGFLQKNSWLKHQFIKKSIVYSLNTADQIIAVSNHTVRDLEKLANFQDNKINIVYHGISPTKNIDKNTTRRILQKYNIANDFILFVGTRRPHKNIIGLIKGLKLLREKYHVNIDMVIAGKAYSDYTEPERLTAQLHLDEHIHFIDFVPETDLPAFYQTAKIFALISFYEGFGLPLIEAMSYGTPIIGSAITSIPEVVGDCGLLVDPNDIDEITEKLYMIITDSNLSSRLSNCGRMRFNKFSNKTMAKSTLGIYLKALNRV
jgi:glycosyltransferase involved in cell wall biosynthesis